MKLNIIVDALYGQLCDMANQQINKINPNLISPQELVHELYLKFSRNSSINAQGRKHFLAISATAMRHLIIDQLKENSSLKKGANICMTTLSGNDISTQENLIEILSVNKAVEKLKTIEPVLANTVECRYFAGYSELETADALNVNIRTVRRYWRRAKHWLNLELSV